MAQTKPKAGQFYGVSGNGTAGQVLISDGNGGMSWGSNTEEFTVSWDTPTGQSLTYTQPNPQSSTDVAGATFPTTTFTVTPPSGKEISGTATIAGLPTGITATQSLSGTGADNILTVTLAGVFPGADSLNTALTISGLTVALPLTVEYLIVAGGGAGGGSYSGGGGAGGYRTNYGGTPLALAIATDYTVTVGAGGAGNVTNGAGGDGGDSKFGVISSEIISAGGGGGGGDGAAGSQTGRNGGSGGGGIYVGNPGGTATPTGQGNDGGAGSPDVSSNAAGAGGGGGAGAAGASSTTKNTGGNGGVGLTNAITVASGTGPFYAGGGGGGIGGSSSGLAGTGGSGLGGNGSSSSGSAGTVNTGSGGGGSGGSLSGGNGGSGIVILRYPDNYTISGLSGNTDTSISGVKITTFTNAGTGNIQFN
tara:strand:- start:673 stop:1932 length:1260 start_codon:yes stop_codon:yes gene_type:complete